MSLALVKAKPETRSMPVLIEYRCHCGKLLFRADLKRGSTVEAWCRKCERLVQFRAA